MIHQPSQEAITAAQAGAQATGIPASVTLAQWALESGWGAHSPGNNPFGIKCMAGYPSQEEATKEYVHGQMASEDQPFAEFPDLNTAFMVHDQLLANASAYANARAQLPDVFAFANALTGVYATDPNYGTLLGEIIRDSDLTQYDVGVANG